MAHQAGITLSEADLSRYIQDLLFLDGWRVFRMEPVSDRSRGRGFGEPGMPDLLAIRYNEHVALATLASTERQYRSEVEAMWLEVKRPGGRVAHHQRNWITVERASGALVLLAGEDFEATPEGFAKWYREQSGLLRKPGLC